jgi:hypothetical protein
MNQIIMKKAGEEKANKIDEMFKLFGGQWAKVCPLRLPTLSSTYHRIHLVHKSCQLFAQRSNKSSQKFLQRNFQRKV